MASQIGFVHDVYDWPWRTITNCSGCETGSDRRISASTMEKIAVLAPIPSASERMAMSETKGVARSERKALRRSVTRAVR